MSSTPVATRSALLELESVSSPELSPLTRRLPSFASLYQQASALTLAERTQGLPPSLVSTEGFEVPVERALQTWQVGFARSRTIGCWVESAERQAATFAGSDPPEVTARFSNPTEGRSTTFVKVLTVSPPRSAT